LVDLAQPFEVALFFPEQSPLEMSLTLRYFFNKSRAFVVYRTRESKAMTTFSAKSHEVRRDWYLVDASGKVLRAACRRNRAADCAANTSLI